MQNGFGRQGLNFFQQQQPVVNRFQQQTFGGQNMNNRTSGGIWQNPPQPLNTPQPFQRQGQAANNSFQQNNNNNNQGNNSPANNTPNAATTGASSVQARLGPVRTPITAPTKSDSSASRPVLLRPGQDKLNRTETKSATPPAKKIEASQSKVEVKPSISGPATATKTPETTSNGSKPATVQKPVIADTSTTRSFNRPTVVPPFSGAAQQRGPTPAAATKTPIAPTGQAETKTAPAPAPAKFGQNATASQSRFGPNVTNSPKQDAPVEEKKEAKASELVKQGSNTQSRFNQANDPKQSDFGKQGSNSSSRFSQANDQAQPNEANSQTNKVPQNQSRFNQPGSNQDNNQNQGNANQNKFGNQGNSRFANQTDKSINSQNQNDKFNNQGGNQNNNRFGNNQGSNNPNQSGNRFGNQGSNTNNSNNPGGSPNNPRFGGNQGGNQGGNNQDRGDNNQTDGKFGGQGSNNQFQGNRGNNQDDNQSKFGNQGGMGRSNQGGRDRSFDRNSSGNKVRQGPGSGAGAGGSSSSNTGGGAGGGSQNDGGRPGPGNRDHRRPQRGGYTNTQERLWERVQEISGSQYDLDALDMSEKKFNAQSRLFVGSLPREITLEELKEMFSKFGELGQVYFNKDGAYAFINFDFHTNAEKAMRELNATQLRGRAMKVRFAAITTGVRVKNLSASVTNELLYKAFSVFGPVETSRVIVDDRGKPTGEGIVIFTEKKAAVMAFKKCQEESYFLTSQLRPVIVEPWETRDDEEGYPEANINKNEVYKKDRKSGPRFAEPNSFESDYGKRWKQLFDIYKEKRLSLENDLKAEMDALEVKMQLVVHQQETEKLRKELAQREQEALQLQMGLGAYGEANRAPTQLSAGDDPYGGNPYAGQKRPHDYYDSQAGGMADPRSQYEQQQMQQQHQQQTRGGGGGGYDDYYRGAYDRSADDRGGYGGSGGIRQQQDSYGYDRQGMNQQEPQLAAMDRGVAVNTAGSDGGVVSDVPAGRGGAVGGAGGRGGAAVGAGNPYEQQQSGGGGGGVGGGYDRKPVADVSGYPASQVDNFGVRSGGAGAAHGNPYEGMGATSPYEAANKRGRF